MTTESYGMEIPVSEFEQLARSCRAWRKWASGMEYALVGGNGAKDEIPFTTMESWVRAMPNTDVQGILMEVDNGGTT